MAALTCDELIAEVKDYIGRPTDTALITDTRVLRWLNEGQREIAEQVPGLTELEMKNLTSVDFSENSAYAMADWTSHLTDVTTSNRIAHIKDAWYIDGADSYRLKFYPTDDFDDNWPDPTNSDFQAFRPSSYTRRGDYIEVAPICATTYCDKTFRLDAYVYPTDFTATDSTHTSDLDNCDEGLINHAVWKAWAAIGRIDNAVSWKNRWDSWLDDLQANNDKMTSWIPNIYD